MAKKIKYSELTEPRREQVVRRLMEEGGSNVSVAKALGTKPNTIASYRHRKKIPSTNPAPFGGTAQPAKKEAAKAPKKKPNQEPRLPNVPGLRESPSEAARCEAPGMRCPYEATPGTPFCPLHQPKQK